MLSGLILIQTICHFDGIPEIQRSFFLKVSFEKNHQTTKNHENLPAFKEFKYSVGRVLFYSFCSVGRVLFYSFWCDLFST